MPKVYTNDHNVKDLRADLYGREALSGAHHSSKFIV